VRATLGPLCGATMRRSGHCPAPDGGWAVLPNGVVAAITSPGARRCDNDVVETRPVVSPPGPRNPARPGDHTFSTASTVTWHTGWAAQRQHTRQATIVLTITDTPPASSGPSSPTPASTTTSPPPRKQTPATPPPAQTRPYTYHAPLERGEPRRQCHTITRTSAACRTPSRREHSPRGGAGFG